MSKLCCLTETAWRNLGETLDGVRIALCLFDFEDQAITWNRTFLDFFPEHENHVHVGESYFQNLRRFYKVRLTATELQAIESYVLEGVARHRTQWRPFEFSHRGEHFVVSSLPIDSVGRVRLWRKLPTRNVIEQIHDPETLLPPVPLSAFALDQIADGIMVTVADGSIQWVNQAFLQIYAIPTSKHLLGRSLSDIIRTAWSNSGDADWDASHEASTVNLEERLRFAGAPFELLLPYGRWVRIVGKPTLNGASVFTHVDVTALKRQQRDLEEAESRARQSYKVLEATVETLDQGIVMINSLGIVEICNRRAIELLDLPSDLCKAGVVFKDLLVFQLAANEFANASPEVQDLVRSDKPLYENTLYDWQRPNGRIIEVRSVLIDGGCVLRTYSDVTERRRLVQRLRRRTMYDALTSLITRDHFLEELDNISRSFKYTAERFAILFIDLDGFKLVNDRHGHAIGDQLLSEVGRRLQFIARDSDLVARFGGDEFVILQRKINGNFDGEILAERILANLETLDSVHGHVVAIGASIGVAYFPDSGIEPNVLLCRADEAMYLAKSEGKNRVKRSSPLVPKRGNSR